MEGVTPQEENLSLVDALLHGQQLQSAGGFRISGLAPPDVMQIGDDYMGDLILGWEETVNGWRTGVNSQALNYLTLKSQIEMGSYAPGHLFEARLDFVAGRADPSAGVKSVGGFLGIGFPSASPHGALVLPAAGKMWIILRALGGPFRSADPALEGIITSPSEVGLPGELYVHSPSSI